MMRNAQPGQREWREVKRCPVQGNSQNDRILHGPDCNRHKRVYADSFPAIALPQIPGIQQAPGMRLGRHAESIGPMGWSNHSQTDPPVTASRCRPRGFGARRKFYEILSPTPFVWPIWFKKARALVMRFLRHGGIYRTDVSSHLINLVPGPASRSGPGQAIGRAGRTRPAHRPR